MEYPGISPAKKGIIPASVIAENIFSGPVTLPSGGFGTLNSIGIFFSELKEANSAGEPASLKELLNVLYHEGSYETEDGVELRESCVDEGVGEHVVSLAYTYDTVCADLTLTDG